MDCDRVQSLLSAYYDQELSSDIRSEVAEHLAICVNCATELAGFSELSAMAKTLSHPAPPTDIWDRLESQLHTDHAIKQHSRRWPIWTTQTAACFAWSAAVLILVALGWLGYKTSSHNNEHEMAAVFGEYLDRFQVDPHAAQKLLLTKYESHAVAADQTIRELGYRPLVADGLPPGYSVMSTHVMKMPCCTCVQCFCQREDGTAIAIFEHDDEEPDWFGDRASRNEVCGGTRCSLVQLDDQLAATWRHGNRHVSIIGARDTKEVSQLVAWFDDRRKKRPR